MPSRSTLAAWSSRCRRQPSASCRFIPISAASSPCASGNGAASGMTKSPPICTAGRSQRRHGRAANRRTVRSATPSSGLRIIAIKIGQRVDRRAPVAADPETRPGRSAPGNCASRGRDQSRGDQIVEMRGDALARASSSRSNCAASRSSSAAASAGAVEQRSQQFGRRLRQQMRRARPGGDRPGSIRRAARSGNRRPAPRDRSSRNAHPSELSSRLEWRSSLAARHLQRSVAGEAAGPLLQPADVGGVGAALL